MCLRIDSGAAAAPEHCLTNKGTVPAPSLSASRCTCTRSRRTVVSAEVRARARCIARAQRRACALCKCARSARAYGHARLRRASEAFATPAHASPPPNEVRLAEGGVVCTVAPRRPRQRAPQRARSWVQSTRLCGASSVHMRNLQLVRKAGARAHDAGRDSVPRLEMLIHRKLSISTPTLQSVHRMAARRRCN